MLIDTFYNATFNSSNILGQGELFISSGSLSSSGKLINVFSFENEDVTINSAAHISDLATFVCVEIYEIVGVYWGTFIVSHSWIVVNRSPDHPGRESFIVP
jgi:hypothetical protein